MYVVNKQLINHSSATER